MRIVAAVALYGIVWPPTFIVWSVTDDSSFGGAVGASAGFSAGLDSCARKLIGNALAASKAANITPRFFTRSILSNKLGLPNELRLPNKLRLSNKLGIAL